MSYYNNRRYADPYRDYDWDNDGYPGEYVYGEDVYIDDHYMDELWKPVQYFPDYWVSNRGRLYSTISNSFIHGTPVGKCGHIDVSLRKGGIRYHALLHRLVAETFLPNPYNLPIVRHLDDNPSNNDVSNLAWGTTYDNVHDCINSGNFRYFTEEDHELAMQKRRTPVTAVDLRTGEEIEYISQQEAARKLKISQASIAIVLRGGRSNAGGYYFYYTNRPKKIDVSEYKYSRHYAPIRAINLRTGEEYIFIGQTEAAKALGMSIASVSTILSGKTYQAKGYTFEYVDEEDLND